MRCKHYITEVVDRAFSSITPINRLAAMRQISDALSSKADIQPSISVERRVQVAHFPAGPVSHLKKSIAAWRVVSGLARRDALNELDLAFRAKTGNFHEMIYALAFICNFPTDAVMNAVLASNIDFLLLLCRAHNLAYSTVSYIISQRTLRIGTAGDEMDYANDEFVRGWYDRHPRDEAERILRFVRFRLMSK